MEFHYSLPHFKSGVINVIGFTTLFWELDRGGPVMRTMVALAELPAPEMRFLQDDEPDKAAPGISPRQKDWSPRFLDYFYSTFSNSMAFSATDAMPLSARFKLLMLVQAFGGFLILTLVIARSVNILQ